jgi:CRP-like cAMP-binding protein
MKNFLWGNIFKQPDSELEQIARLWQNTPLFKGIPARHIAALAENMHVRQYQQDEVIFHQGDQGAGAILVLEGQVRIMARNTTIAELQQGDFFGEIALAENDQRTADAYCELPSRLVFFLKQDLEEWIEVEPRLGTIFLMNLASTLAQRLLQANQLLAQKD